MIGCIQMSASNSCTIKTEQILLTLARTQITIFYSTLIRKDILGELANFD